MGACIFCQIVAGTIPAQFVYQSETVIAFPDRHPQAPTHILIVPKQHIATMNEFPVTEAGLAAELIRAAQTIAAQCEVATTGYRLIVNTHRNAGQEVFHLHWHLLGGKPLGRLVA